MTRPGRAARRGASTPLLISLARATVTLAAGAGLVYGAGQIDHSRVLRTDPARTASVDGPVTSAARYCPGAELAGIPDVPAVPTTPAILGSAAPLDALGSGLVRAVAPGTLSIRPGVDGVLAPAESASADAGKEGASTDRATAVRASIAAPDPAEISATGAFAPAFIAGQETAADGKTVSGVAGLPCLTPAADAWLTGGSADPGRQERLLLVNPGANAVTVDVDAYGKAGPIQAGGGEGIVVPPRSRTTVLLDALTPREPTPAYHVVTRGGFVVAGLSDYWLDGLTPRGLEDLAPLAAPGTRQVIPGVAEDLPARVRVIATGESEALVQVRMLTIDGPLALPGGRGVLRVPAGTVSEVAIPAPRGAIALEITADQPVTAAVLSSPARGRDFGWAVASAPIADLSAAAYPPLPARSPRKRTLALAAVDAPATATITTRKPDGTTTQATIDVPADASRTVDISDTIAVWVRRASGAGILHAAITTSAPAGRDFALAGLPLTQVRLTATPVAVQAARD